MMTEENNNDGIMTTPITSSDNVVKWTKHPVLLPAVCAILISLIVASGIVANQKRNVFAGIDDPLDEGVGEVDDGIVVGNSQVNQCQRRRRTRRLEEGEVGHCQPWCTGRDEGDEEVCDWKDCSDCDFCSKELEEMDEEEESIMCPDWCTYQSDEKEEGICNYHWASNCTSCGCSTFVDVTKYKLSDAFFQSWYHSGRPYSHETSPIYLDWNGDGILDYFDSLHAHPGKAINPHTRWELTESVPYNSNDNNNNEFLPDSMKKTINENNNNMYRFQHVQEQRIFLEESFDYDIDPHGQNMLDLDGDGILDIMISSGGGRGDLNPNFPSTRGRNNFLFWGEESTDIVDEISGKKATIFRGGRETSEDAGVAMEGGRGRVNYMMDINNDGMIDIFCFQGRPINNLIIPGVMLMNNGDRTWTPDTNMQEYTISMILTDVDGDGLAQELVVSRSFCYPQRKGPQADPKFPEYGPFPSDVKTFCHTRPVGSLAIYKYNEHTKQMKEISKTVTTTPTDSLSTTQCPHGSWVGARDCNAKSMATGDFDGDLKADLMVLYGTKIDIFLSSDRKKNNGVIALQEPSSTITLKNGVNDGCAATIFRVLDIDNDGQEEILVMCEFELGGFLLYTRGHDKDVWHLESPCSAKGALGDLHDPTLAGPTEQDLEDLCNKLGDEYGPAIKACQMLNGERERGKGEDLMAMSLSPVDLNNDGFIDIVTTHDFGYTRYYQNAPGLSSKRNRFITFQLKGGRKCGNIYGIGATVILYGERRRKNDSSSGDEFVSEPHHQFRQKSTYQHTPDKFGSLDDRITFGLGIDIYPLNVTVRWSNGYETVNDLSQWTFVEPSSMETYPVMILGDE